MYYKEVFIHVSVVTVYLVSFRSLGARNAMFVESVNAVTDKPTEDSGMANWPLSKTLSLLGVAILVHLVVMTSLADRGIVLL